MDPRFGLEVGYKDIVYIRGGCGQIRPDGGDARQKSVVGETQYQCRLPHQNGVTSTMRWPPWATVSVFLFSHVFSLRIRFQHEEETQRNRTRRPARTHIPQSQYAMIRLSAYSRLLALLSLLGTFVRSSGATFSLRQRMGEHGCRVLQNSRYHGRGTPPFRLPRYKLPVFGNARPTFVQDVCARAGNSHLRTGRAGRRVFSWARYIEFVGEPNNAAFDSLLYSVVDGQPNPMYSLFSDSLHYFLTYGGSLVGNKRFSLETDNNTGAYAASPYYLARITQGFQDTYHTGPVLRATTPKTRFYMAGEGYVRMYTGPIRVHSPGPRSWPRCKAPFTLRGRTPP